MTAVRFGWVRYLPPEALEEFIGELVEHSQQGDSLDALIASWQSTAEVYADAELHRRLTEGTFEDHGPVPRPAEDDHRPMLVRWNDRHSAPAEVCDTCSNPQILLWVPVTFCEKAKAKMTDDAGSLYADDYGVIRPEGE